MIRGIRKEMIQMKPKGNRYFEEVQFILHPQKETLREEDRRAMLAEAHRILRESQPHSKAKGGAGAFLIPFLWGLLLGSVAVGIPWLLTLLLL